MCANVRRAKELVDSQSDDVYMELPMDCETYKTSKNNVQRKHILDVSNNREIFLGPYSEILFYDTEANAEKQREFTHELVFPALCQHTRGLAIARICGLRANCWQLLALLRDSSHVDGSHVRKSAFLLYTHTQNPGTCIRGTGINPINGVFRRGFKKGGSIAPMIVVTGAT